MKQKDALSLKTLTKSSVWDIQENDVFRLWEAAEKDADLKDNMRHYLDVIRSAFEIEEVKIDKPVIIKNMKREALKLKLFALMELTSKNTLSRRKLFCA